MGTAMLATAYGSTLDYVVIAGYFLFILGFGTFFGRFSKNTRDFFFGGQRFAWWLIGMSMVATGVGSYSFVKYSAKGFEYGLSSSMTYTNDWFFIPFFMFGWLPIIYFSRVRSIPEYFERRFDRRSRVVAVIILLMYNIGYIGFNMYTLAVAANSVLGVNLYVAMTVIAVISAIYIAVGGQTAVIFTDLVQGFMLLGAGLLLFVLGLNYLGADGGIVEGIRSFWTHLNLSERLPFAHFNRPPDFNFVGVFWQDGVASSITFLFISQGLIMRFLAAKSMNEGRKTILFNTVFLLPFAAIVVGNAGWLGNVMAKMGYINPETDPKEVFVHVAELVCSPGVFGFVLAALSAALMSTIDTLTNASSALFVFDVYQPYLAKKRNDQHYLKVARIVSLVTSLVGLGVGALFAQRSDMYQAHANFIAVITPPIVVSVFLGAFWRRYTPAAAFYSMFIGALVIWLTKFYPKLIKPFADLHGVEPNDDGSYTYMTAFFGICVAVTIGVVISLLTKPKPASEISGLWIGSINAGRRFFKGREPDFRMGKKIKLTAAISEDGTTGPDEQLLLPDDAPKGQPPAGYAVVRLSAADMAEMKASEGDLIYIADARRWLGGLRSLHCRVGAAHDQPGVALMSKEAFESGNLVPGRAIRVEKFF